MSEGFRVFKHPGGAFIAHKGTFYATEQPWDDLVNRQGLYRYLTENYGAYPQMKEAEFRDLSLRPPISSQEIWASGVTYMRSKEARMEESEKSRGDYFYDRVYDADRPELFFKSTAARAVGHGDQVRIRKDSTWNVPEPELTLFMCSEGTIEGYTIGNDMSSRSIEGDNPLYLPQAKTYDQSAAIGPCLLVTEAPLPLETRIDMNIYRDGQVVFEDQTSLKAMKRSFQDLVGYLFRETSFPSGCFLMTGTGIVPPSDFTLDPGDQVRIKVDPIGELVNEVVRG